MLAFLLLDPFPQYPEMAVAFGLSIYRVSIKPFADYKHLLQENYCTWNINKFFFSNCNPRSLFATH
jgi:hypothetical protein